MNCVYELKIVNKYKATSAMLFSEDWSYLPSKNSWGLGWKQAVRYLETMVLVYQPDSSSLYAWVVRGQKCFKPNKPPLGPFLISLTAG